MNICKKCCVVYIFEPIDFNIYGPNLYTTIFYSGLLDIIQGIYSTQQIILGGDFNIILNTILDFKKYIHIYNPKSRAELCKLIEILILKDVFREYHIEDEIFTWIRETPIEQVRFDFLSISLFLLLMVLSMNSENSYRSDYSPVELHVTCLTNECTKGKGFWTFHTPLL